MSRQGDGTERQGRLMGAPVHRLEDVDLLRGHAGFVGDLKPGGLLSVRFVRCPLAHARVRNLSLASIRQMPGVVARSGRMTSKCSRDRCSR